MSTWALIVAAGSGTRMGMDGNKVLAPLCGRPVLRHAADAFSGLVDGTLIVTRDADMDAVRAIVPEATVVTGGDTRQQSVLRGLCALPEDAETVLVHDGARPLVDRATIERCLKAVRLHGSGVAGMPVKDTIKQVGGDLSVLGTPPRASLWVAQTPQAFRTAELRAALEALQARGDTATDDAGAMELFGRRVQMVEGAYRNIKLTTPEDMQAAGQMLCGGAVVRVGHGWDAHRLADGRPLVLGGVTVPFDKGLDGHSDADVAVHALIDALLGAVAMGDIGRLYPDSDAQYRGIASTRLLADVAERIGRAGFAIGNVDVTIVCQRPRLAPYVEPMRRALAGAMRVDAACVSVKATTSERMGFEGEGLGISAQAVVTLYGR